MAVRRTFHQTPRGALQRLRQAIAGHRLQQIVDGFLLEGGYGVLVVRGLKDDQRPRLAQMARHVEPADLRHRDVEQEEIGPQVAYAVQGLEAVRRFTDAFGLEILQQAPQPDPRRRLVVHDHYAATARSS